MEGDKTPGHENERLKQRIFREIEHNIHKDGKITLKTKRDKRDLKQEYKKKE